MKKRLLSLIVIFALLTSITPCTVAAAKTDVDMITGHYWYREMYYWMSDMQVYEVYSFNTDGTLDIYYTEVPLDASDSLALSPEYLESYGSQNYDFWSFDGTQLVLSSSDNRSTLTYYLYHKSTNNAIINDSYIKERIEEYSGETYFYSTEFLSDEGEIVVNEDYLIKLGKKQTTSTWASSLYRYIVDDRNTSLWDDVKGCKYELIYLDDDTIPEVYITYSNWAAGCKIVSYQDGGITQLLVGSGGLNYEEYGNSFHHSYGHMGLYFDTIFKIDKGKIVTVAEGKNETTVNADGSQNYDVMNYYWNGHQVSKEDYIQNISTYVDSDTAKTTSHDNEQDYAEILTYLLSIYTEDLDNSLDDSTYEDSGGNQNGIVVYSDYTNLSIRKGSTITLSAGILTDGELEEDVSGITFQIEDTSALSVSTTDIKDNCRYVKLKGLAEGTTTVVFNDSNTGYTAKVPVTVYDDNYLSYTLNSVPTQNIEKYPTNVYNVNGLYIDSYKYTVNNDQSATVSFDVYNTNHTYGVVEVFDENGNMKDAVLIEKMTSSNTSIKKAVWDNIGYLVRDIIDGDLLSYRQESGYTKKTSVSVKIPQNGYIKICTDPENSLIVGLVNSVDGLMSMASLAGDIKDFDVNSKEFSKKLTTKLLTDQVYVELIKDGSDASKDLWKNVGKETFITSESMGSFTDTITKNIDELKLGSIIADTATDFGWDVGENVFTYFAGPAGTALNVMFTIGKVENLIIQQNDLIQSAGVGSIYIQNQGGGLRSCQQIKVESEDEFSSDTALNVFTVTLDSALLDVIKVLNPDVYEAMTNGITYTYNISLLKNGDETQPEGKVTVYIPIPEDLKVLAYTGEVAGEITGKVKIYRVEEDGSLTEMDVEIEDGCFVFTTNHFSLYTIVGYDSGEDTVQNQDGNGISTIAIIGIASVVIVGVGIMVIFKRKKK